MSPKIVDKDKRRKEIASIALELFADKGFETTSISQIAQACRMGKATIYEYFKTKNDLIFESIMVWIGRMVINATSIIKDIDDPVEKLRLGVTSVTQAFISDDKSIKIAISIFQTVTLNKEFLKEHDIIQESFQTMRKEVIDIFFDGISKGIFRPEIERDAENIAINLMAYLDGICLHYLMSKGYFNLMDQVNFYLDNLLRGIRFDGQAKNP